MGGRDLKLLPHTDSWMALGFVIVQPLVWLLFDVITAPNCVLLEVLSQN